MSKTTNSIKTSNLMLIFEQPLAQFFTPTIFHFKCTMCYHAIYLEDLDHSKAFYTLFC